MSDKNGDKRRNVVRVVRRANEMDDTASARELTRPEVQAAAVIHTDFEKGFIRAETIAFDDFIRYRGESGARDAGRLRLEGKEYVVQEGDVLHFRFNV